MNGFVQIERWTSPFIIFKGVVGDIERCSINLKMSCFKKKIGR
jgi:hypothetical protein